uniref:PREDICTED: kinesin family member 4 isoform 2 putati n=1 Tax=Albugo laibachii Nc14 TaxID=890382 RepID=F0WCQ4_9STRA|nr:PREDICTED: kinesin family member 4 isoform 2 putati [Albugo laibachii Nc14]CCA24827.1 predicted protein putative [Albugo laibachii Nc14]|eukprot:CCA24827.1 predicted protein putative [Albugo laibachii Nc14]
MAERCLRTQEISESAVKVAVRVRPLSSTETAHANENCLQIQKSRIRVGCQQDKEFDFDAVYSPESTQEEIYTKLIPPLLDRFFDGYNATVFAYGQTGSGKTYTMGNEFKLSLKPTDRGIIPRCMEDIFDRMRQTGGKVVLKISYLEVLNEEIHDLLVVPTSTNLSIRDDGKRGICIAGLSEHTVESLEQVAEFLQCGTLNRKTASTNMNATSSRSHAICTLTMEQCHKDDESGNVQNRYSKFHLVDLAGSERAKRTNAEGLRFREGVNINKGLLALGNVINSLCERERTHQAHENAVNGSSSTIHVPYRDSKLTRLLQDSLGGNSKTLMIACVSPADVNYDEISSTLRYATRARKIQNQAVANCEIKPSNEITSLRQQVELLQLQLLQQKMSGFSSTGSPTSELLHFDFVSISNSEQVKRLNKLLQGKDEELRILEAAKEKWKRAAEELSSARCSKGITQSFEKSILMQEAMEFELTLPFLNCTKKNGAEVGIHETENGPTQKLQSDLHFLSQEISEREKILGQLSQITPTISSEEKHLADGPIETKLLAMTSSYTQKIFQLEKEIDALTEDKKNLASAIHTKSNSITSSSRLKDQLKTLQQQLGIARGAERECKRLTLQLKNGTLKISTLEHEVSSMKRQKANLQRQLKEESERHRKESRQQQLEILRLKRQEERKQYELQKLSALHAKQNTVLKRKTEEVAAANKRMRMMHTSSSKEKSKNAFYATGIALRSAPEVMASPVPVSVSNLVHDTLDVQITLLGAINAIRMYQDERKELALKIARVEKSNCASIEDLKSVEESKRLLREKNEIIRTLQAKVAAVEEHNPIPDELFPTKDSVCHSIIKCLLEEALSGKATDSELKSCKEDLRETEKRLINALEDLDYLRENSQKPREEFVESETQTKDEKKSRVDSKKSTKGSRKTKKYEILSDDGLEDSLSEDSSSGDDSDYVEDEEELKRDVKQRKRIEKNSQPEAVTYLEIASAGSRDSMEEIDRLLLQGTESKPDCCKCNGKCATKLCACRANKQDCGIGCSCHALKCHNRPEMKLRLQKRKNIMDGEHEALVASLTSNQQESFQQNTFIVSGKENHVKSGIKIGSESLRVKKPLLEKSASSRVPLGGKGDSHVGLASWRKPLHNVNQRSEKVHAPTSKRFF